MNQVDILMATYNGAKYIAAQIRSLQSQTFTDWRLLIHDDGSTDATMDIINGFAADDERIRVVDDGLCFHSSANNFMHLLTCSDAPFCIFCDQDDIWLENKVGLMLEAIRKQDNNRPQAVYSNSYVYKSETEEIDGHATLALPTGLEELLFLNTGIQGCALMMNAALRDICKDAPDYVVMHDYVVTMAAAVFGGLTYLPMRLMLYRRHEETVTGFTAKNRIERVQHFFERGKTVISPTHFRSLISFFEKYDSLIPPSQKAIYSDFLRLSSERRIKKCWHILRKGYKIYGHTSILLLKVLTRRWM